MVKQPIFHFQPFSEKQMKVLCWWSPSSPVKNKNGIICDGAIRSGKTVVMSLSFVMWAMSTFEEQNFAMCGKTIGSFRRNVLAPLKLMLRSRGYNIQDKRADNLLVISHQGVTNYFYVFGGKDEGSQDLIQGVTLAGCLFDEVALMPESFVNQATARCSVAGSKFWFNCNPEGPFHYFKLEWIDKREEKGLYLLHFTMDDNLSLAEEVKERYRSQYSGVFYDRYIKGLWKIAEGIIYDMFSEEKHLFHEPFEAVGSKYISCDYGTQNPTVFHFWAKRKDGAWCCTKEYYYSGRDEHAQKTDAQYADDLIAFMGEEAVRAVIVDPSAASFIAELRSRGVSVMAAKNDVLDGIRLVGKLLKQERLLFSNDCKNTIKEFYTYAWDEKAAEHGEDKPLKVSDHCADSIRYFCNTIIHNVVTPKKRPKGL